MHEKSAPQSERRQSLNPQQAGVLKRLKRDLEEAVQWARGTNSPPTDWEHSNTFGLLGPRGAGKSTLLNWLSPTSQGMPGAWQGSTSLAVLPPLDCTCLPQNLDVPPAASFLLHLERTEWVRSLLKHQKEQRQELEDLASTYYGTGHAFQNLCLELSSTPDEFAGHVKEGVRARLGLQQRIFDWLNRFLDSAEKDALVLLLDDFDLISGHQVRKWLACLQDQLHQHRLLIVLTADYHRLEHLSLDKTREIDDKTGRALLGKLLPPPNRFDLEPWSVEERLGLVKKAIKPESLPPHMQSTLEMLLPRWPRGLQNLKQLLLPKDGANPQWTLQGKLARCREESLLARRLDSVAVNEWIRELPIRAMPLRRDEWAALVECASSKGSPPTRVLPGLLAEADRPGARVPGLVSHDQQSHDISDPATLTGEQLSLAHDPRWLDPLRHDELRLGPLRDAVTEDRSLWAEWLLDLGLQRIPSDAFRLLRRWRPLYTRTRDSMLRARIRSQDVADFIERDFPREVALECGYSLSSPAQSTVRLVHETFPWWRWRHAEGGALHIEVSFWHLALAVSGQRIAWPTRLLAELLLPSESVWEAGPSSPYSLQRSDLNASAENTEEEDSGAKTTADAGSVVLLPAHVRSTVLLVDALDRCPWRPLTNRVRGLDLLVQVGLAAAFVETAYLYALVQAGLLRRVSLGRLHRVLHSVLESYDPLPVLKHCTNEDQVATWLPAYWEEGLPDCSGAKNGTDGELRHPLLAAALAFFNLRARHSVITMTSWWLRSV